MKRSDINRILLEADGFIRSFGYVLPPFAYLTPAQMKERRGQLAGLIAAGLGWDVTDYGKGDFARSGLFLFTTRNGRSADLPLGRGMLYAEKIMISRRDQVAPIHRHDVKTEDIINRGGGTLALKLYMSNPQGAIDREAQVSVPCDGVERRLEAGGILRLSPGESVTLAPGVWHAFWGEDKDTLVGEVSTVNDDETDNIFAEPVSRFSRIDEDEEPVHLLVSDYRGWLG